MAMGPSRTSNQITCPVFLALTDAQFLKNQLAEEDPETHGTMFSPIILGSDKTTVSVAMGQNEYYPLYSSSGSIQNHVHRAHRNALTLIGFLAIPKSTSILTYSTLIMHFDMDNLAERHEQDSAAFRKFRRQLFHSSLAHILMPLKPWMSKAKVTRCADGHFHRVIYGIGPYIADYPEQALLACVVSGWCPRFDFIA